MLVVEEEDPITEPGGAGGLGGGGSAVFTGTGGQGTYATGGGGGGSGGNTGGNGGSGIVVVRYQIAQLTATAKATGGLISYYGGKTIHTFLSLGTFTVTNPSLTSVDYLVVAGGGAGGSDTAGNGGGGGAGGLRSTVAATGGGGSVESALPVSTSPGSYTVTIGGGGAP
ncbi:MAG UNVERIFIED_CONTAM: hypothetical protein LVR29_32045 [Microcystis novacekii LVE1205-3]|jgi:hypothetical protein